MKHDKDAGFAKQSLSTCRPACGVQLHGIWPQLGPRGPQHWCVLRVSCSAASCAGHMLLVDIICFSPQTSSYGNLTPSAVFRVIFRSWQLGQIASSLEAQESSVEKKKTPAKQMNLTKLNWIVLARYKALWFLRDFAYLATALSDFYFIFLKTRFQ